MTKQEAAEVVAHLNAAFPRDTLEEPTVDVFIAELETWEDAAAALEAGRMTARQGLRFPTIAELRQTYRQQVAAARAETPALREADVERGRPEWVEIWRWYRVARPGDARLFPQQAHYVGDELLDYDEVRALWLARTGKPAESVETAEADEFLAFMGSLPPVPP